MAELNKNILIRSSKEILEVVDRFVAYYSLMHKYVDKDLIKSSLDRGAFVRPQDLLTDDIMTLLGPNRNSHSYAYGPEAGDTTIRALVAQQENLRFSTHYEADNVALVPGAWAGVGLVLEEIFQVGRPNRDWENNILAVIGPTHYQLFHRAINVNQIDVRGFDFVGDGGIHIPQTLDELEPVFSASPKAIFITNPNNPDGLYLPRELTQQIVRYCKSKQIFVIIDEINDFFVHHDIQIQYPLYGSWIQDKHVVRIDSFSKKRALAEYRVGWVIADSELLGTRTERLIGRLSGFLGNAPRAANTAIIRLLEAEIAFLKGEAPRIPLKWEQLEEKRKFASSYLSGITNLSVLPTDAGINICVIFPPDSGATDLEIASQCMERGSLIMPAGGYGYDPQSRCMRITFAERWEKLEHGLSTIKVIASKQ